MELVMVEALKEEEVPIAAMEEEVLMEVAVPVQGWVGSPRSARPRCEAAAHTW